MFERVLAEELRPRPDHRRGEDAQSEPRRDHQAHAAQRQDAAPPGPGGRRGLPHGRARQLGRCPRSDAPRPLPAAAQGDRPGRGAVAAHRLARPLCGRAGRTRRGRWPTSSTKSTAAAAPPPTGTLHQAHQAAARPEGGDALQAGRPDPAGPRAGAPAQALPEGPPRAGRGQSAAGGVDRQALPQPGPALHRPDPGGQPRPDAGRGQVRASAGLQVRHLRHLVDSAGHHARPGRSRPHHPRAVPSGGYAGGGRAGARGAVGGSRAGSRRWKRSPRCWA